MNENSYYNFMAQYRIKNRNNPFASGYEFQYFTMEDIERNRNKCKPWSFGDDNKTTPNESEWFNSPKVPGDLSNESDTTTETTTGENIVEPIANIQNLKSRLTSVFSELIQLLDTIDH